MAHSLKYTQLKERVSELRAHLLPSDFSETGNYEPAALDMAKGYRLLVHAEIESYIEEISRELITDALSHWDRNKKPSITMISFLAAYHSSWSVSDELSNNEIIQLAKNRTNPKNSLKEAIDIATKQFVQKLKSNHGIKSDNFKTLILPTGVDIDDLDPDLLLKLDSYGSKRGDIAHNSSRRVTHQINPEDELSEVTYLINCLEALDVKIQELRESLH